MIGVDPGVRGGIAVLSHTGAVLLVEPFKPSMTERDLTSLLKSAAKLSRVCLMEKVGYIKGDGGKGAFTFGNINGLIRGVLLSEQVRIYSVYPMVWQAKMNCLTGGNKNVSKRRAQELFPDVKVTHSIADALLIAEYGRQSPLFL